MDDTSEKKEANTQSAKAQRLDDARQAMAEYEAATVAIRAKTERLRALRLARDAANPPGSAKKRKTATTKKGRSSAEASGNLANWLSEQAKEGRRG